MRTNRAYFVWRSRNNDECLRIPTTSSHIARAAQHDRCRMSPNQYNDASPPPPLHLTAAWKCHITRMCSPPLLLFLLYPQEVSASTQNTPSNNFAIQQYCTCCVPRQEIDNYRQWRKANCQVLHILHPCVRNWHKECV